MIKLYNELPEIYYDASRDFQALARVYEVLYNYTKTNVDILESLPFNKNFDARLLDLMASTIGFTSKHNYNTDDLFNLCFSFAKIIRQKGSKDSINATIGLLLNSQHIKESFNIKKDPNDAHNLLIYIPREMTDLVLLEDMFDYILPAGYTYSFYKASFLDELEGVHLTVEEQNDNTEYGSEEIGQVSKYNTNITKYDVGSTPEGLSQTSTGVIVKYPGGNS